MRRSSCCGNDKYRETADALHLLTIELDNAPSDSRGAVVVKAEALMQAENSAWLQELKAMPA